jgi:hypothetical protein
MKKEKNGLLWKFRVWLYYKRQKFKRDLLLKKVIEFSNSKEGSPFLKEGCYLKENGLKVFPYSFEKKYKEDNIDLFFKDQYPFFNYRGKSLFLPKEFTEAKCRKYGNQILLEQDDDSPHNYSSSLFNVDDEDVIMDIGCAEGNFSLEHIDSVKEVYLFELDTKWEKPLNLTFEPWKDKVHLSFSRLQKGIDSAIPTVLTNLESKNVFFKIDVDGVEREILSLLDSIFPKLGSIKVAICTYHQADDATEFASWFESRGFKIEFSSNFMLFYHDKMLKKPFFRQGVLFATKN